MIKKEEIKKTKKTEEIQEETVKTETEEVKEAETVEIANAETQKEDNQSIKEETEEKTEEAKKKPKKSEKIQVDLKALLEAGVHFGHLTYRWNPKMEKFIFTKKNGVHIIDLTKTAEELEKALSYVAMISANGGNVLFVGTKSQAKDIIREEAIRSGSPFIGGKWLGGTLTNFSTMTERIKHIQKLEDMLKEDKFVTKKEKLDFQREYDKLIENFEGIREMKKIPQAIFIVDSSKEKNAIKEARKLGIATIAMVDTNADPEEVEYAIPSNDDAIKSIKYITSLVADTIIKNRTAN